MKRNCVLMQCFDLCALLDKGLTITGFISHAPFLIEILIEHVWIVPGSNGYCCPLEIGPLFMRKFQSQNSIQAG